MPNVWSESIIEYAVMSGPTKREIVAIRKLMDREPMTKADAAHLIDIVYRNPNMKVDDMDLIEFQDWLKTHYDVDVDYIK